VVLTGWLKVPTWKAEAADGHVKAAVAVGCFIRPGVRSGPIYIYMGVPIAGVTYMELDL
jgi:hypothetical protein